MLTSSSSVTAIKYPASEISTSSNILLSKPSPFVTCTDFKLETKNSDLDLSNSIMFVAIL